MSSSAFEEFRAKLAHDGELREQLSRALTCNGTKDRASFAELVAFARTCGYDFSEKEVLSKGELSDEQLEVVAAGGGSNPEAFDCSELVQWASSAIPGVKLSPSTSSKGQFTR